MRLSLSHWRSEYAVYLLLNNLLRKKQPCRQTWEEPHLSGSQHASEIKAFHHTMVRKCLFRSFPRPFLLQTGLESFWNLPWVCTFVLKRSFADVAVDGAKFGRSQARSLGVRSRVSRSRLKKCQIKITFTSSSITGFTSWLQGDLKMFKRLGPTT